jgi:putative acetyltransferase
MSAMGLKILKATSADLPTVRGLFLEYASSLDFDLSFQNFDQEMASLPGDYAEPYGCILMAIKDEQPVGCVALRPISKTICEMKRLYVRTQFQGHGIGRVLAVEILKIAADYGYEKLRLDTVPSMKAAIQMYETMGFYAIDPYRENPVDGTAYLEKKLAAGSSASLTT